MRRETRMAPRPGARFQESDEVDFVVVGSGAAGGVLAKELSQAGFQVVVLEQGPWRQSRDFTHDELGHWFLGDLEGSSADFPQTFRRSEEEQAEVRSTPPPLIYARGVGGSSVHFTANYWRLRPVDFRERSRWGSISGTGFADWPITYDELEPYYTKVDWEIGVSGAQGPFDPPRSRPYPMPPLPVKSSGVLLERGARALGWNPQPAPMAITSRSYDGRPPCMHCGFCMRYGCEWGAKSSTLVTVIPRALETGRCEIRPHATVFQVETDHRGRATGVAYWDADGVVRRQRARAVVLAANGAETARLLLMSDSSLFPQGLANSSGKVGKYLMFNGQSAAYGVFEHPLNEHKSVQVTRIVMDFYDSDPRRGFYGGGGIDGRMAFGPVLFSLFGLPSDAPTWGPEYKRMLGEYFPRTMEVAGHTTSLPVETNSVSLDPGVKDRWGRPALRVTYRDHPDDLAAMQFFQERSLEILEAAGARRVWSSPVEEQSIGAHLLGTCRMGDDPAESVVDPDHRAHDVPNLFICDGSSMVTSGRGQPTMTIQALAYRAADRISRLAGEGSI
jgi:choline dehydrogenase-like flavoprotein